MHGLGAVGNDVCVAVGVTGGVLYRMDDPIRDHGHGDSECEGHRCHCGARQQHCTCPQQVADDIVDETLQNLCIQGRA